MNPHRPILDAGPALNFFAARQERLLFQVLGSGIWVPESVDAEIRRKAREPRLSAAKTVVDRLPEKLYKLLADDYTPALDAAVARICEIPLERRMRQSKDLGETLVLAHAAVLAEQGADVVVMIDDGGGRALAQKEIRRLDRRRAQGHADCGSIGLIGTLSVLESAGRSGIIDDRGAMRAVYERIRAMESGLGDISTTGLLAPEIWR